VTTVEIRLKPRGPFRLPPRAPMLWGHLAWALREQRGEGALRDWLERFQVAPPFLISSAFPSGFLPRPLLPTVAVSDTRQRKALKRVRYISFDLYREVAQRGEVALVAHLQTEVDSAPDWLPSTRTRVTIDRGTGGALEGALYDDELLWFSGSDTLSVYLRGDSQPVTEATDLLKRVGVLGYGGRASIGMGHFTVEGVNQVALPEHPQPTHAVTLAPVLPNPAMQGYWRLETYWGRLGGYFASQAKPFKRPHLRVVEGSTLDLASRGGMLELTPDPPPAPGVQVWDYLYAFPLGISL